MEKLFRQKVRLLIYRSSSCRANIVLERQLKELQGQILRLLECNSSFLLRRMPRGTDRSNVWSARRSPEEKMRKGMRKGSTELS
jgi:hypothetical protein